MRALSFVLLAGLFFFIPGTFAAVTEHVTLRTDGVEVDGKPMPYWYAAEVQYFRARGGAARNVPAEQVTALWNKLADRVLEAKMNAIQIYIPWDFHEPEEGVFDFDGTLDRDGDGRPDYPSRNLRAFINLFVSRGITKIMVRPGPYINAEWGPTGFGAIPKWFLEKYPEALTVTRTPGKPKTASFGHPIYRERTRRWFAALYHKVLKDYIGPGKPVVFLQLDNETNYFWDSLYERDYSPTGIARYREFLRARYATTAKISDVYGAKITDLATVEAPTSPTDFRYPGNAWHYDWFLFHDVEIRDYYRFLRATWEKLGVREPDVLFTSCDSFNAPENGLLPRLDYRQDERLTLTTMNVYPKTFGTQAESTLNEPMKAAHDATLVAATHRQFYGGGEHWVMSSETVGGWFPPTEVSLATRQHTYGSLLGAGVKAITIYYFHEGYNWDGNEKVDSQLRFDAPLDENMNARPAFGLLKHLGVTLAGGLGATISASRPLTAKVLLAHDSDGQYPLPGKADAVKNASSDAAGLFGLVREAGFLPEIGFVDRMSVDELARYKIVFWSSPGYVGGKAKKNLEAYLGRGGTVVAIGDSSLAGGKVISLKENPGRDWNSDRYPKLATAAVTVGDFRRLLGEAGLRPIVESHTEDRKAGLHVWLRSSGTRTLLFVENFLRESRNVDVRLTGQRLVPLWGQDEKATVVAPNEKLAVGPDRIEIWEVVNVK